MKRHLNLMPNRARIRACVRTRVRQWSAVLAVVLVLLIPLTLVGWWPVYQEGQQVKTLEAQYEPIRQLRDASRTFEKRIELVRRQEKIALSLAQIDTPVVTLLGLVGKSVSESNGRVYVEKLVFHQDSSVLFETGNERMATVDIGGRGLDREAVNQLTASLHAALPFATVQLKSSQDDNINVQQMQKFTIECSF